MAGPRRPGGATTKDPAATDRARRRRAGRRPIAARNQIRRLPHACPAPPRRLRLLTRTGLDSTHKYSAIAADVAVLGRAPGLSRRGGEAGVDPLQPRQALEDRPNVALEG